MRLAECVATRAHLTRLDYTLAPDAMMAGRGPTGIAAAAVYLSSRMGESKRTQREVSQAAGVTEVTIRNRYREICEALEIDPENPTVPEILLR